MGNKAILMSIKPQYVAKILNGEKTIEVRKKFPKDYVGWVYIYCTKGKERLITYDKYLGDETVDGYKIIIKDEKGGIKLCESKEEFDNWYNDEIATIEIKYQYLNTIKQKAKWDGVVPLIDKANNPVKKYEPIDVFYQFDDEDMTVNTNN